MCMWLFCSLEGAVLEHTLEMLRGCPRGVISLATGRVVNVALKGGGQQSKGVVSIV